MIPHSLTLRAGKLRSKLHGNLIPPPRFLPRHNREQLDLLFLRHLDLVFPFRRVCRNKFDIFLCNRAFGLVHCLGDFKEGNPLTTHADELGVFFGGPAIGFGRLAGGRGGLSGFEG